MLITDIKEKDKDKDKQNKTTPVGGPGAASISNTEPSSDNKGSSTAPESQSRFSVSSKFLKNDWLNQEEEKSSNDAMLFALALMSKDKDDKTKNDAKSSDSASNDPNKQKKETGHHRKQNTLKKNDEASKKTSKEEPKPKIAGEEPKPRIAGNKPEIDGDEKNSKSGPDDKAKIAKTPNDGMPSKAGLSESGTSTHSTGTVNHSTVDIKGSAKSAGKWGAGYAAMDLLGKGASAYVGNRAKGVVAGTDNRAQSVGAATKAVGNELPGTLTDTALDMLPVVGTYRAFQRGDMVGGAIGLALDATMLIPVAGQVGLAARIGRVGLVAAKVGTGAKAVQAGGTAAKIGTTTAKAGVAAAEVGGTAAKIEESASTINTAASVAHKAGFLYGSGTVGTGAASYYSENKDFIHAGADLICSDIFGKDGIAKDQAMNLAGSAAKKYGSAALIGGGAYVAANTLASSGLDLPNTVNSVMPSVRDASRNYKAAGMTPELGSLIPGNDLRKSLDSAKKIAEAPKPSLKTLKDDLKLLL